MTQNNESELYECSISRLVISETQETPTLVVLQEKEGARSLTIGIHIVEAIAINRKLNNEDFPRPMTHDLCCRLISKLGGVLMRVVVNDIIFNENSQGTFYAYLEIITQSGEVIEIDSRPSDAIAIAIRFSAPIFVAEKVLDFDMGGNI
jgi:hypothetical protein